MKKNNVLTITIKDRVPSINEIYAGIHWAKRKRIADEKHELVAWAVYQIRNKPKFPLPKPVWAEYEVHYRDGRRHDWSNAFVKVYEDGLVRAGVLEDDNSENVLYGIVTVKTGQSEDKLIIRLHCV